MRHRATEPQRPSICASVALWLCGALVVATMLACPAAGATEAPAAGTVLADFEVGAPRGLELTGWESSPAADAAAGKGALRLSLRGDRAAGAVKAAAWLPVQGWDGQRVREVTLWLRARSGEKSVRFRMVAADE